MTELANHQLARMNVVLACEQDSEGHTLLLHLQRTRASVRHVWPVPETIGEAADIVLTECVPGLGRKLAWMPGEASAALIALLPQHGRYNTKEVRASLPDAVLFRPYLSHAIDMALMLALDHFSFARRMRHRVARLDENLHALRDIERVKHAIMLRDHVDENSAYKHLRDLAMERRMTIAELAAKLVDSGSALS